MDFFDKENSGEIIHNIQEIIHCPFCGSDYQKNNIKIMGKVSGSHVVQLLCSDCGNRIMASLAYQKRNGTPSPENVFRLAQRGPINDNEIMDFFGSLNQFDGNFQKTFRNNKPKK